MLRTQWVATVLAVVALGLMSPACGADGELPDGHFPCGVNGGSCELGAEVCVVVDGCSTCVAAPEPCDGDVSCDCLDDATDADPVLSSCHEQGTCELDGGGLSLSCEMSEPMIGCG